MTFADLEYATEAVGLMVMGTLKEGSTALILLGAAQGFWTQVQAAPEGKDGAPDPIDRYSTRIVGQLATAFGASARFPFGGPPYEPFIDWAKRSGRAWSSPTGMLVHDTAGLMISYRGALVFARDLDVPDINTPNPCLTCADRPCVTACPVNALSADAPYDVPACHGFLDTKPGGDCMAKGCAARRACPVSQSFGRDPAQSAHHMRAFHPT